MFKKFTNDFGRDFQDELETSLDTLNTNTNVVKQDLNTEKSRLDTRINTIIQENPQPSEVVDARGGHAVLGGRLDEINAELAQIAKQKVYTYNLFQSAVDSGIAELDLFGIEVLLSANVTINNSNLLIKNGKISTTNNSKIIVYGDGVEFENVEFDNVQIDIGDYRPSIGSQPTDFRVENCNFDIKTLNKPAIHLMISKNAVIKENTFIYSGTEDCTTNGAIWLHNDNGEGTSFIEIEHPIISKNIIKGKFHRGIHINGTAGKQYVILDGNYVEGSISWGIYSYHSMSSQLMNNKVYNCGSGMWCDGGSTIAPSDIRLPANISFNQVKNCGGVGIYVEELEYGNLSNNSVFNCVGDGIVISVGAVACSVHDNVISRCNRGIALDWEQAPTLMKDYWNTNVTIKDNIIENCVLHGIFTNRANRLLVISGNRLNSNNTSNNVNGFAINLGYDTTVARLIIKDNLITNQYTTTVPTDGGILQGYQLGLNVGCNFDSSGVLGTRKDFGAGSTLHLINNIIEVDSKGYVIGYFGDANILGSSGIIKNNFNTGITGSAMARSNFHYSGNIGFGRYDEMVSGTKNLLRLGNHNDVYIYTSFDVLPAPTNDYLGVIVKVARGTTEEKYYICKRNSTGVTYWAEAF